MSDAGRGATSAPAETITRRVDGFMWLAKHSRRPAIVAFVRGVKGTPPDWLAEDRVWPKVKRDRAVWRAAQLGSTAPVSLRGVAAALAKGGVEVSYQTVANVLDVYSDPNGPAAPDAKKPPRLKLKSAARKAVTPEVVARFDAGELTAVRVAELIGAGADHRNALYWLCRMRLVYAKLGAVKWIGNAKRGKPMESSAKRGPYQKRVKTLAETEAAAQVGAANRKERRKRKSLERRGGAPKGSGSRQGKPKLFGSGAREKAADPNQPKPADANQPTTVPATAIEQATAGEP